MSDWWKAQLTDDGAGELLLYGEIGDGWWSENKSKDFIKSIKTLGAISELTVRINSIGGDVFAGMAIYNYLRGMKARKTVIVDGIAASIASVVAMSGDRIVCPANAMIMIHNPWSYSLGDGEEMRKTAEILDRIRGQIAGVYVARTGLEEEVVLEMMASETWMTGTEAVESGFADEVGDPVEVAASVRDGFFALRTEAGTVKASMERVKAMRADLTALFPQEDEAGAIEEEGVVSMNLEELKTKHPELYAAILEEGRSEGFSAGVEGERQRMQELEELDQPGCGEIIARAKYETFTTAQDCAIELLKAQRAQAALDARRGDAAVLVPVGGMVPEDMPGQADRDMEGFLSLVKSVAPGARTVARSAVRGVE